MDTIDLGDMLGDTRPPANARMFWKLALGCAKEGWTASDYGMVKGYMSQFINNAEVFTMAMWENVIASAAAHD